MQNLFIMKNRLFTILPLLLLFFSFNLSATIHLECGIVGAVNINGDFEIESSDLGDDGLINLTVNKVTCFGWSTNHWSDDDITDVELSYSFTYGGTQIPMTSAPHVANPTTTLGLVHPDATIIAPIDNTVFWTVPLSLSGDFVYITICDSDDPNNKHTVASQISGSAKTGNLSMKMFDVNYYPNPVINSLNIQAGETTINSVRLYDLKGNSVGNYKFNQSYQETIDVSALPSGTYVAIINEEEQVKIVKR